MQAYTELTAPSAVTHSLSLSLTSATATNLVVAKGSLLQIFETKTVASEFDDQEQHQQSEKTQQHLDHRLNDDDGLESSFLGGDMLLVRADRSDRTKLVLVSEIPLAGCVTGLARLKLKNTSSGGDALLLAYKAAKLCLTAWNPARNTLDTISIHYYEKDELQGAPWELPFTDYDNYIEADPGSRCVAYKFGSRNLAILPFAQTEEDLEIDDWDEDLDGPRPTKAPAAQSNGEGTIPEDDQDRIQNAPSFVLRLPLLDPSLLHPLHFAFLHEYREPTFGILSSTQPPSAQLGVKDHLTYKVFTLDPAQRASTTILSVTGLPLDLFRIVALPAPIGGALLVGQNELIHVDQSGKTVGIAVNPMTSKMTNFSLVDRSELNLRLESCLIEQMSMPNGELLLILNNGRLGVITFNVDGRTVSSINVRLLAPENGGILLKTRATSVSAIGKNSFFVGSEGSDSFVLGWSRKHGQEKKRKPKLLDADLALEVDELDLDEDEEEDDDDLYGETSATTKQTLTNGASKVAGDLTFRKHDSLLSIAPIRDLITAAVSFVPDSEEEALSKGVTSDLQLACAVGTGNAGAIAILNRNIQPKVIGRFDFPEARGFWTMNVKKPMPKALGATAVLDGDYDAAEQYDKYMIVAKVDLDGYETSDVYVLTAAGFETLKDTEFEPAAGLTVEAGTMGKQMRIIQVLKSEVRSYDGDLGLVQILPMLDEETGQEPRVNSASMVERYLLLLREDNSIFLAEMDKSHELEEMDKSESVKSSKWVAGCLYTDTQGTFQPMQGDKGVEVKDRVMMFLLSQSGAMHVYDVSDLSSPVYVAEGLVHIPPFLSANYTIRRGAARESVTVTELLVADLGDVVSHKPYLILRQSTDDLTLYESLRHAGDVADASLSKTLTFKKSPNPVLAGQSRPTTTDGDETEPSRHIPLRPCPNVGGYKTVFLPGESPAFVLKSSKSVPRVIGLEGLSVRGMSSFHTEGCDRGFIYADSDGIARVTQLPPQTNFTELGLSVRKVALDSDVHKLAYHHPTGAFIAGCHVAEAFELPKDDDYHKEWARESLTFPPTTPRGVLKLISPITMSVISTTDMESCESIESMKTLNLEVSEETKERKMLLAVGTALTKGEDLPARGRIQVFDIVNVIPQPGRPETNRRLKLIADEDIPRGGVTALSEVGSQGLMLVAQGQKCMVRGLKEDGSLLPVAFLDMNCHVVNVTALPDTGLCLMADAAKGVWFAGYTEEPYTFAVLGKSSGRLPLLTAEFLPDGEDLSIVAADTEGDLHIFELDPDHPKSLQGHLLLHRTTFSVAPSAPTISHLLPRTTPSGSSTSGSSAQHILLLASPTGSISSLVPLNESTYRRLLSVTNQLLTALVPHGGLNAKAYRMPAADGGRPVGVETGSGRAIVDGAVLARWNELGAGKRAEIAGRGGYDDVEDLRAELERILGWTGVSYF